MRSLLVLPFVALVLAACGSSSPSTTTDAGADAAVRTPAVHRGQATACPSDRPAGTTVPNQGSCATDAECTQGKNGRCVSIALAPSACTYDTCFADSDCGGSGDCQCRDAASGGANACRQGNCKTDADCGVVGRGFCSPSGVLLDVYCRTGVPAGSFGWFCHVPADECVSDSDCGSSALTGACIFDVTKQHWACSSIACTD